MEAKCLFLEQDWFTCFSIQIRLRIIFLIVPNWNILILQKLPQKDIVGTIRINLITEDDSNSDLHLSTYVYLNL